MNQTTGIQRKLTTILAADAANYSGRMREDEVATVQALRKSRAVFETRITERGGRIANTAGDGLIAEFPSVVEAVAAAVSIQRELNSGDGLLPFRIGLHLGDVIVEGEDLLGDGVNMAARLQGMAVSGGVLVSQQIVDQAKGRLAAEFRSLGPATLKHLGPDVSVFAVLAEGLPVPDDLADVLPRADGFSPLPAAEVDGEITRYKATRNKLLGLMGGLVGLDVITGPGATWATIPVMALAVALYLRRRKVRHLL